MNFASDTTAPAHPDVLAALADANDGAAPSYGADAWTGALRDRLRELFETDRLAASIVGSGTGANALALSVLTPAHGAILCHHSAHIHEHERGAPEFYTGGAKLLLLAGDHGRISDEALAAALAHRDPDFVHESPASSLSLSNLTELGTVYRPDVLARLASAARAEGLSVHLDGARFANAVAATGASPADMSWRSGVDALSFGLTKTGGINAEIVVLFGETADRFGELEARRKRAGLMPPKARFAAAEAQAMLAGGLWLELARRANEAAARLAEGLSGIEGVELLHPVEGNLLFARLPKQVLDRLGRAAAAFYRLGGDRVCRFVCSWATTAEEVDALLDAARRG
ncbi:MAG TPA: beta-eliminating lyase-related protein [Arenicellales bacterium]|nr:beta-eliminating lyase-related protein [Arenicellales bacterium]